MFKSLVKCEDCKHIIDKTDAQKMQYGSETIHYCPEHKKPYSRKSFSFFGGNYYYGEVEMDEKGIPIGYQEIPETPVKSDGKK